MRHLIADLNEREGVPFHPKSGPTLIVSERAQMRMMRKDVRFPSMMVE
jgi:hypothetical protein